MPPEGMSSGSCGVGRASVREKRRGRDVRSAIGEAEGCVRWSLVSFVLLYLLEVGGGVQLW